VRQNNSTDTVRLGALMVGTEDSQAERRQQITNEIEELQIWTRSRVIAYRRQRDFWQRLTYYLLALSALTAIGAAISAGLSARIWSVVFAGISAGASVINASLKTGTQIARSEKDLSVAAALGASISALKTDLPHLSVKILERRLQQLREQYQEALKLPQPSEKELNKAIDYVAGATSLHIAVTGNYIIGQTGHDEKSTDSK
jgi:hypothetical protein